MRVISLQWRHNERDGVSNHQPHDCLLNRVFRRRSKKPSKPRVTGFCVGNSPVIGEIPAQRASNEENVSIWWRHYANDQCCMGSPHEGPRMQNFDSPLLLVWTSCWSNSHVVGNLKRLGDHVTSQWYQYAWTSNQIAVIKTLSGPVLCILIM